MIALAAAPALPLHAAGPYVAAAYLVFLALVLVYVVIMALRLTRNQRELAELRREILERQPVAEESLGDAAGTSAQPGHPAGQHEAASRL